jgi:uncharacterized protein DUF4838
MKRLVVIGFALAFFAASQGAMGAAGVRLDSNTYVKLIARGKQEATAKGLVAMDKYLCLSLGKKKLRSGKQRVKVILEARYAGLKDVDLTKLTDVRDLSSYEITVRGGPKPEIHIIGMTGDGLTFGVYDFLENDIGVTWLFPGPAGTALPKKKGFEIKAGTRKVRPEFVSRVYTGMTPGPYPDFYNSLRLHHLIFSSHAMIRIFPIEESKRLHPEIFPMKKGKRHIPKVGSKHFGHGEHWHPCYTNPKTVEVATTKALKFFKRRDGLTFSLGINDGTRLQCDCKDCKKVGWPQSYYQFVNKVADNVKEYYPPFLIGVLAYGDVEIPHKDLKLAENVLVLGSGSDKFMGKAKHLGVYEYLYGWGFWVPNFPLKIMKSNALVHRKMGAMAIHAEVHPVWAFDAPKVYIRSRLLWNADYDVDAGLERWCNAAFGKGAEPMLKFYRLWASKRDKDLKPDGITFPTDISVFRVSNAHFAPLSDDDYDKCAAWLAQARKQANDPVVSKRLDMIEPFFDYSRIAFKMWQLKRTVFESGKDKNWAALAGQALALKQRREGLLKSMRAHKEWFYGTRSTVDRMLSVVWEGRWTWTVFYENDNAIRTALYNAGLSNLPLPKTLPEPYQMFSKASKRTRLNLEKFDQAIGYYHDHIYNQMNVTPRPGIAEFRLNTKAPKKIPDDTPHAWMSPNRLKLSWFRASTPLSQDKYYAFDVTVTGAKGKVDIRIHNENDCGMKIWLQEEFGAKAEARTKRLLLKPVPKWGTGVGRPVSNWSVEIIFTPSATDATFNGECSVNLVEFDGAK